MYTLEVREQKGKSRVTTTTELYSLADVCEFIVENKVNKNCRIYQFNIDQLWAPFTEGFNSLPETIKIKAAFRNVFLKSFIEELPINGLELVTDFETMATWLAYYTEEIATFGFNSPTHVAYADMVNALSDYLVYDDIRSGLAHEIVPSVRNMLPDNINVLLKFVDDDEGNYTKLYVGSDFVHVPMSWTLTRDAVLPYKIVIDILKAFLTLGE